MALEVCSLMDLLIGDGKRLMVNLLDPTHCQDTVYHLRRLMETSQIPIMGICLGHQLLALAAGARTIKLKYGVGHSLKSIDPTVHLTQPSNIHLTIKTCRFLSL